MIIYDKNKQTTSTDEDVRASGLGPLRLGGNSESFRQRWQNEFAHRPRGIPYFPWAEREPRFFWYFGTGTGGTNW